MRYYTDPAGNVLPRGISYRPERFRIDIIVNGKLVTRVRKTLDLALLEQVKMEQEYPSFTKSKIRKLNSTYRATVSFNLGDGRYKTKQKDMPRFKNAVKALDELRKMVL